MKYEKPLEQYVGKWFKTATGTFFVIELVTRREEATKKNLAKTVQRFKEIFMDNNFPSKYSLFLCPSWSGEGATPTEINNQSPSFEIYKPTQKDHHQLLTHIF